VPKGPSYDRSEGLEHFQVSPGVPRCPSPAHRPIGRGLATQVPPMQGCATTGGSGYANLEIMCILLNMTITEKVAEDNAILLTILVVHQTQLPWRRWWRVPQTPTSKSAGALEPARQINLGGPRCLQNQMAFIGWCSCTKCGVWEEYQIANACTGPLNAEFYTRREHRLAPTSDVVMTL
jgi:hypothetical protein